MVVTGSPPAAVVRVLRRMAVRRPHVLLVPVPGATGVRLAAERLLRERGWPLADSPAAADIMVVCGQPGRSLADAVDQLWRQVPGPRARARVASPDQVAADLDRTVRQLAEAGAQRRDAVDRSPADTAPVDMSSDDMGSDDNGGMDMGSGDDGGMDMGGMDMPAGLMMADRGEDRDGLKLDQLHVQLGPVLPDWPAGLVLHVVLQGDVIQQAELDLGPVEQTAAGEPFWDRPLLATGSVGRELARRRTAAAHLDSAHRLLAVAGWEDAASTAALVRDELLDDELLDAQVGQRVARFARRVGRSRTLRWSTRGLGVLSGDDAMAAGIGGPALRAAGDVHDRLMRWLSEAAGALQRTDADDHPGEGSRGPLPTGGATRVDRAPSRAPSRALAEVIPSLIIGLDIAGARLVIASLDPDTDELAWAATREPVDA